MTTEQLDPVTPREFLEALHRLVHVFEAHWDEFPNGDGASYTLDDDNQTKTDIFNTIAGCADYGLGAIKAENLIRDAIEEISQ